MKKYLILFLYISFLNAAVTTRSIVSPRSAGLGTGIHGNIGLNDTLRDNPASIAFTKSYGIEGLYISNSEKEISVFDISVVDSKTSNMAGGFAYSRLSEITGDVHDIFYLAMAERYWRSVSIGLGAKYVKSVKEEKKLDFYDLDAGILFAFSKRLGVGVSWKNFLKRHEIFSPSELNLGFQAALGYFYPTFNITKMLDDNFRDMDNLIYSAGLEIVTKKQISARMGYRFDNYEDARKYSLGCGWKAPKISFDYAWEGDTKESSFYQHLLSMRIFF